MSIKKPSESQLYRPDPDTYVELPEQCPSCRAGQDCLKRKHPLGGLYVCVCGYLFKVEMAKLPKIAKM